MSFDWTQILKPASVKTTAYEVHDFEKSLGFALPDDYKSFLLEFNGGTIIRDHEIFSEELDCNVGLKYLDSVAEDSPRTGLKGGRRMQELERLYLRQSIRIGSDWGTGFYHLILAGERTGSVYFAWKDDPPRCEGDWYSDLATIPDCMVKISSDFDSLGELILENLT